MINGYTITISIFALVIFIFLAKNHWNYLQLKKEFETSPKECMPFIRVFTLLGCDMIAHEIFCLYGKLNLNYPQGDTKTMLKILQKKGLVEYTFHRSNRRTYSFTEEGKKLRNKYNQEDQLFLLTKIDLQGDYGKIYISSLFSYGLDFEKDNSSKFTILDGKYSSHHYCIATNLVDEDSKKICFAKFQSEKERDSIFDVLVDQEMNNDLSSAFINLDSHESHKRCWGVHSLQRVMTRIAKAKGQDPNKIRNLTSKLLDQIQDEVIPAKIIPGKSATELTNELCSIL